LVSDERRKSGSIMLDFKREATNFKRRVPVRLRIEGVEMFGGELADGTYYPWDTAWIHAFVPCGLFALLASKMTGNGKLIIYPEWGWLDLRLNEGRITVSSTFVKKTVEASFGFKRNSSLKTWPGFEEAGDFHCPKTA